MSEREANDWIECPGPCAGGGRIETYPHSVLLRCDECDYSVVLDTPCEPIQI